MKFNEKTRLSLIGAGCGFLNGIFGSGGGILAVPLLEMSGLTPKKSHAVSVAIIFFLSVSSSLGYIMGGNVPWEAILPMIPAGLAGSVIGSVLLKNVDNDILRRIFGVLIIYSGGRMILS